MALNSLYYLDAPPHRSGFFRRLDRSPKAVYAAIGLVAAFVVTFAAGLGGGSVVQLFTGELIKSNPMVASGIMLVVGYGLIWVYFLIVGGATGFAGTGFRGRRIVSQILGGLLVGVLLVCVFVSGSLLVTGTSFASIQLPTEGSFWLLAFVWLAVYTVQGGAEELMLRGLLPRFLGRRFGMVSVLLLTSALFSVMHFKNGLTYPSTFLTTGLAGAFFFLLAVYGRSLWVAIAAHGAHNFVTAYVVSVALTGSQFSPDVTNYVSAAVFAVLCVTLVLLLNKQRPGWHRSSSLAGDTSREPQLAAA